MNRKITYQLILAASISAFSACNQQEKKSTETGTTDSTANAKTDTAQSTQPPAQNAAMDAVTVAPNLYHVVSDTMGIRVLDITYKPGDSSAMHSHPDNVVYTISGGTSTFTEQDGKKNVVELKPGTIMVGPGEVHSVKNTGKTTVKALLVEVNRPKETMAPNAALDATKISPALYKVKKDTLGIRVLEVTYKPGDSSAMHAHPDNAVYVINGATMQFTEKDGTKRTTEFKPGMAVVRPGGEHSVKNVGKTTLKVLLIEVNRPMK